MKYSKTTLPNGIRVLVAPMPTLQSATVTIWVGTGSRYEDENINGISHFLEHMVFKGGKKYKTPKAVSLAVDSFGGEFNASTSKEWTNFYIRAHKDKIEKAFDVLSDIVFYPLIQKRELERERGVILEEISMYEDSPQNFVWQLLERSLFQGSTLEKDVIGTKDVIKNLQPEDFFKYREKYYYPENIVITVSGGVEANGIVAMIEKNLSHDLGNIRKKEFSKYTSKQEKPRIVLLNQKREQGNFVIGFPGLAFESKDHYSEIVLDCILGGGQSSRLWTEIREKRGMAYSVGTSFGSFLDTGSACAYAGVKPEKIYEALKVVFYELYKLAGPKHNLTEKELIKSKEYFKGHFALSLERTSSVNYFLGNREILLGKTKTPEEIVEGVEKVTIDEVLKLAQKLFVPRLANLAVIGPYKDQGKFEKLLI